VLLLENLNPAKRIEAPKGFRPAIEFDGDVGVATLQAVPGNEVPKFDDFLIDQGFDPELYEVVGSPRTSRWQQREDGDWLTSYKFNFRRVTNTSDLVLLWQTAKSKAKPKPYTSTGKALVVMLADFQLGKVDHRGGLEDQLPKIFAAFDTLEAKFKSGKYERIVLSEQGDIVEGFSNKVDQHQLHHGGSIMQQVDLASSLIWDIIKRAAKYAPVTYATVASNHCQNRVNKQKVGLPGLDDWGIFIAQQISKLVQETNLDVQILIPDPHDESLAFDVFGDEFHVLGLWHGHQSARPESVPQWWEKQTFGQQPVSAASIGLTGHFHHLRVQELGLHANGGSRYWIQGKTMDNGSSWFRLNSGQDSQPGLTCFELEKGKHFTGSVFNV
jgi:hypothetical protein